MTNPTLPLEFTNVNHADVNIGRHAIIGSGSVVLPGVNIEDGVAVGALSLVTKNCEAFTIYSGSPLKRISSRHRNLLELEKVFVAACQGLTE
jgi:galactoside O-acetyltransferase